ncbi:MAG: hypothetical protein FDZ75_07245 [Actinobacteria bacterium]|nr:MAG: hypothetical protein FDZ75_07245 [Actinomycetota bacterium]
MPVRITPVTVWTGDVAKHTWQGMTDDGSLLQGRRATCRVLRLGHVAFLMSAEVGEENSRLPWLPEDADVAALIEREFPAADEVIVPSPPAGGARPIAMRGSIYVAGVMDTYIVSATRYRGVAALRQTRAYRVPSTELIPDDDTTSWYVTLSSLGAPKPFAGTALLQRVNPGDVLVVRKLSVEQTSTAP